MLVWSIYEYIKTEKLTEKGYDPGLGGLVFMVFAYYAIVAFLLDLITSLTLRPKWNWIVQSISVLIFILVFIFY